MNKLEIYQKYRNEFYQYLDDVSPKFNSIINKQRIPFDSFLKKIYNYYFLSAYIVDKKLRNIQGDQNLVMFLYSKAALSVYGIYSTLMNGLISESVSILRSLFEIKLNSEIIFEKDTIERVKLWYNFRYMNEWNSYNENLKLVEKGSLKLDHFSSTFTLDLIDSIKKNYEKYKNNYHPKYPYHWAWKIYKDELKNRNPKIKFLCEKFGLTFDYVKVYQTLSAMVHGSSSIENIIAKREAINISPLFSNLVFNVGSMAVGYSSDVIENTIKYLDEELYKEIIVFIDDFVMDIVNSRIA